jgi:hypothetical protein
MELLAIFAFIASVAVVWYLSTAIVARFRKQAGLDKAPTVAGVDEPPAAELVVKSSDVTFRARGLLGASPRKSGRLFFTSGRLLFTNTHGDEAAVNVPLEDVRGLRYQQSAMSAWGGGKLTITYRDPDLGQERSLCFQPAGGNTQFPSLADEYAEFKYWLDLLASRLKEKGVDIAPVIESPHHHEAD